MLASAAYDGALDFARRSASQAAFGAVPIDAAGASARSPTRPRRSEARRFRPRSTASAAERVARATFKLIDYNQTAGMSEAIH